MLHGAVKHRPRPQSGSRTQSIHTQMAEDEEEMMQGKFRDDQIRRQMEEKEEKPTENI